MTPDATKHVLVPKHTKLSDSDKSKLLEKFNVDPFSLPKIFIDDPAIAKLGAKVGDIIKIERKSKTAGATAYYRIVFEA